MNVTRDPVRFFLFLPYTHSHSCSLLLKVGNFVLPAVALISLVFISFHHCRLLVAQTIKPQIAVTLLQNRCLVARNTQTAQCQRHQYPPRTQLPQLHDFYAMNKLTRRHILIILATSSSTGTCRVSTWRN